MEFDVYSKSKAETVGQGLSRGELNQWLLDSLEFRFWPSRDFLDWFLYDFLNDNNVLGEWETRNGTIVVSKSRG